MPSSLLLAALRRFGHCARIPKGLRYRLLRALVPPDRAPDYPFAVSFFGRRYAGTLARLIDWMVFFFGAHEPHVLAFLAAAARGAPVPAVFLDAGANVGHHTLFMAGRATVHAFEPHAPLVALIDQKIADNALEDVTVHPVGLGARDERRTFFAPTRANVGTGTFLANVGDGTQEDAGILSVVRGDDYLAAHGIGAVGLIKIDVEGFEPYVLDGLRATLARDRPVVQMEWSETTARELAGMERSLAGFLPPRYALFQLLPAGEYGYRLAAIARAPAVGELALIPEERLADIPRAGAISA